MIRLTMHLKGVKPVLVTEKKKNKETGSFDLLKKKKTFNTVVYECKSEKEAINYMAQYIEDNNGVELTKYYFTNVY